MRTRTIKVQVGRDARTGRFISVAEARRRKATAVVETVRRKVPVPKDWKPER